MTETFPNAATTAPFGRRDKDELLRTILNYAGRLANANHGFIQLLEPSAHELRLCYARGLFESYLGTSCQHGEGLGGRVWSAGRVLVVKDYDNWDGRSPKAREGECRALAGAPLFVQGVVTGVLAVAHGHNEAGKAFRDSDIASLVNTAQLVSVVLDNEQLQTALDQQRAWRSENQPALERYLEFERTIITIVELFRSVPLDKIATTISKALRLIGAFCSADLAYIVRVRGNRVSAEDNLYWCAPGMAAQLHLFHGTTINDFAWGRDEIQKQGILNVATMSAIPAEAQHEKRILAQRQVKSLLVVPLLGSEGVLGYLGLDMVRGERVWDSCALAVLHIASYLLTAALERREAEARRDAADERHRHHQRLEGLAVMAGGLAHDFNNVLAAIVGNLYLAESELTPRSPGHEAVEQAHTAALDAAKLTQQLLACSGRGEMRARALNLSELITEWRDGLKRLIHPNAELVFELAPDLPLARLDSAQIRQVLQSIVSNASEALNGDNGLIRVRTSLRRPTVCELTSLSSAEPLPAGDYVSLEISDTGSGIDQYAQERLSDPFFATKFTRRGLGMAAALGVVRGHGGAIHISSQPDRGSVVRILLPILQQDTQEMNAPQQASRSGTVVEQSPLTVLVVDDEPSLCNVLRRVFGRHGFKVYVAKSGREGIELLDRHASDIDVVLLDVTMPGMKGTEVLGLMRQVSPTIPIVLSSGYREEDALSSINGQLPERFIQKPYPPEKLIELLYQIVSSARAR